MPSVTVNISFQETQLAELDRIARSESRSRSELLREAARMYIERRARWEAIFAAGREVTDRQGLIPADVAAEIAAHRQTGSRER